MQRVASYTRCRLNGALLDVVDIVLHEENASRILLVPDASTFLDNLNELHPIPV